MKEIGLEHIRRLKESIASLETPFTILGDFLQDNNPNRKEDGADDALETILFDTFEFVEAAFFRLRDGYTLICRAEEYWEENYE